MTMTTGASFTMRLKDAIALTGGKAEVDANGIRRLEGGNIGLHHPFPIHDEEHRPILVGKIVDHFWNRELGRETLDDFQRAMRIRMNEIMPGYEQLYKSTQFAFDPMKTVDIATVSTGLTKAQRNGTTETTGESASDSNSTTGATSVSRSVNQDFPQVALSPDEDYASSAVDGNGTTSSTSVGHEENTSTQLATDTATEDAEQNSDSRTTGYQGVPSDILMRYRESILNIDTMILADLDELFMSVWDNGQPFHSHNYGWI